MIQRKVPERDRGNYKGLIDARRGQWRGEWGEGIKDLPFGCSVSFRGKNWVVAGFDTQDEVTTVRLVDRLCTTELLMIDPAELRKTTASSWLH